MTTINTTTREPVVVSNTPDRIEQALVTLEGKLQGASIVKDAYVRSDASTPEELVRFANAWLGSSEDGTVGAPSYPVSQFLTDRKRIGQLLRANSLNRGQAMDACEALAKTKEALSALHQGDFWNCHDQTLDRKQAKVLSTAYFLSEMDRRLAFLETLGITGVLEPGMLEPMAEEINEHLRSFVVAYDSMLQGDLAVSDVFENARIFSLYPSLLGKDLPGLLDEAAGLIRADTSEETTRLLVSDYDNYAFSDGGTRSKSEMVALELELDARYLRQGDRLNAPNDWNSVELWKYCSGDVGEWGELARFFDAISMPNSIRKSLGFTNEVPPRYVGPRTP